MQIAAPLFSQGNLSQLFFFLSESLFSVKRNVLKSHSAANSHSLWCSSPEKYPFTSAGCGNNAEEHPEEVVTSQVKRKSVLVKANPTSLTFSSFELGESSLKLTSCKCISLIRLV